MFAIFKKPSVSAAEISELVSAKPLEGNAQQLGIITQDRIANAYLDYPAWTGHYLSCMQTTQSHARFMREQKLILTASEYVSDRALGTYDPQSTNIEVNAKALRCIAEAPFLEGATQELIGRYLAMATLPLAAHEINHAMVREEQKQGCGFVFPAALLEGEIPAAIDERSVLQEQSNRFPQTFAHVTSMLRNWRKLQGANAHDLVRNVSRRYRTTPSILNWKRGRLESFYQQRIKQEESTIKCSNRLSFQFRT